MANPQIDKIADKILGGLPLSKNDIAYLVDRFITNPVSSGSGWATSGTTTLTGTATILGNSLYGVEFGDGIDDLTHFTVITTGTVTLSWNGGNVVASSGAGLEYGGDYSAEFVSRSLIDRGYADGSYWKTTGTTLLTDVAEVRMENQPNRSISLTANNPTRGHIKIGTGLTTGGNTFIDLTANIGSTGGKILLDNQNIVGEGAGLWVTDGLGVGLQYVSDYSAGFTDRSLIDRGFANNNYWKTSGTTTLGTGNVTVKSPDGDSYYLKLSGGFDVNESAGSGYIKIGTGTSDNVSIGSNLGLDQNSIEIVNPNTDTHTIHFLTPAKYTADYSANFTDRSLADWGNVWKAKGTTTLTGDFFLSGVAGRSLNFTDGEDFLANVDLRTTSVLLIGGNSSGTIRFSATDAQSISIEDRSTVKAGIEYFADYSANYTNRSLVDKGYVTSQVTNGTYTPTLTNGTNVAASSVPNPIRYTKIGNVVTVTGIILLDITTASSPASLQISLPIAKDFPDNAGIDFGIGITLASEVGRIISDPTNDTASLTITSANTSNQVVQLNFTYVV